MPTFTIPASAPPPTPTPAKKTNNRRKKATESVVEPAPLPVNEPEPMPQPVNEMETDVAEPEPESPIATPTFPNIVILKQTEHNYIVKHNHYPIQSNVTGSGSGSGGSSTISSSGSGHGSGSGISSTLKDYHSVQPLVEDDLVSPNQIHKGQINKKRGRKPKAGLILNSKSGIYDTTEVPNIILHLKCHISDLKTNESISSYEYTPAISEVESYMAQSTYHQPSDLSTQKVNDLDDDNDSDNETLELDTSSLCMQTDRIDTQEIPEETSASSSSSSSSSSLNIATTAPILTQHQQQPVTKKATATDVAIQVINERSQKEIMKKIHRLKYSFHNGETIQTKMNHRPACFWDTCEFEGPIYYIPIMIVNGVFQVNGCYCSPQCAVAALLKESLDTSTKFERLHLLHLLYGVPNNKGFKPAPNPHYLLDKYYGNLTIQEYRALLKGSQMIHIVNKPLTHILPELYEDNNDFLVNSKVIPANSLKMKKKYKTMVVQSGAE